MKSVIRLVCLIAFLVSLPAWARVCSSCRTNLPDQARFCLTCGQKCAPVPARKAAGNSKDALFRNFAPVDNFEKALKSGTYSAIVGGFPQFKVSFSNALKKFDAARSRLPEELQILGQVYLDKAQACESAVTAMTTLRMDSPYRKALLIYFDRVLTWYNKTLQKARELPTFTPADVANLKAEIRIIADRARRHEVTAGFLRFGRTKVPRGASFAVLDIHQNKAMLVVLCETPTDDPIQRWEPLRSLLDRTTWTSTSEAAFQSLPFSH